MGKEITLHSLIPDPEVLLAFEPEELAGPLLEVLISLEDCAVNGLNRRNLSSVTFTQSYTFEYHDQIEKVCMESWGWLEREGLIAVEPHTDADVYFVTRRGHQVKNNEGLSSFRHSNILPKQLLHPTIAQKVWSLFLRGEYDTAVFQAFKEVEVAVRDAAHFEAEVIGVDLMHQAFKPNKGPLANSSLLEAEQRAMQLLFAGAIGLYKNPHSHRNVTIDAAQAVEMIVLASHLLGIVESRKPKSS